MPNRVQVRDLRAPEQLQPKAAPVDRFAPEQSTSGRQLAAAFGHLAGNLEKGGQQVATHLEEEEIKELKPKVRNFVRDFNRFVLDRYSKSEVRHSQDPAAQAKFLEQAEKDYLAQFTDIDPKMLELARPGLDGVLDATSNRLAQDAHMAHIEDIKFDTSGEVYRMFDSFDPDDETSRANTMYELGAAFESARERGLSPSEARHLIVATAINKAKEEGETEILDMVEEFKRPNGARITDGKTLPMIEAARDHIANEEFQEQNRAFMLQERKRKAAAEKLEGDLTILAIQNPEADFRPMMQQLARISPSSARSFRNFLDNELDARQREDPTGTAATWMAIFENPHAVTAEWLWDQKVKHNIPARTVEDMLSRSKRLREEDPLKSNPIAKRYADSLEKKVGGGGVFDEGATRHLGAMALSRFQLGYVRWLDQFEAEKKRQPNEVETINFLEQLHNGIVAAYQPDFQGELPDVATKNKQAVTNVQSVFDSAKAQEQAQKQAAVDAQRKAAEDKAREEWLKNNPPQQRNFEIIQPDEADQSEDGASGPALDEVPGGRDASRPKMVLIRPKRQLPSDHPAIARREDLIPILEERNVDTDNPFLKNH